MTIIDFLLLLVVAAICGIIAQAIVGISMGVWLARPLGYRNKRLPKSPRLRKSVPVPIQVLQN